MYMFLIQISDFGLSRELEDDEYYTSVGGKIPVKWTAPEALVNRKYSPKSDMWSFGCVLYEIWSLGQIPFREISNNEVMSDSTRCIAYPLKTDWTYLVIKTIWCSIYYKHGFA